MEASDLIKALQTPCEEGAVHIWKISGVKPITAALGQSRKYGVQLYGLPVKLFWSTVTNEPIINVTRLRGQTHDHAQASTPTPFIH
jgi:hypothetical protein